MKSGRIPGRRWASLRSLVAVLALASGCINHPALLRPSEQTVIDPRFVERLAPENSVLKVLMNGLNCPTAMCFDGDKMLIAESGTDGLEPHIFGYNLSDGKYFSIYPFSRDISFHPTGFVIYGPVGGMVVYQGNIYVSHRDREGYGEITAFGYDGKHTTIVSHLPAQGDYGVTDLAVGPDGRLYFGVGTGTNSGVVGLDNWEAGWLRTHPNVHDHPYSPNNNPIYLTGPRFDTDNPRAGLFGGAQTAVTPPFGPFGQSTQSVIYPSEKPNGAICSLRPDGTDFKVEAYGIHNPRGLRFNEYGRLYFTSDGMQPRGTRPVLNDPDVLCSLVNGFYGWPDRTTHGHSVTEPEFAPPITMLIKTGYSTLSPLIDLNASRLRMLEFDSPSSPLAAVFPSLAGAAKLDFVPASGPFSEFRGNAIVALDGDRSPWVTSGLKLRGRVGFKLVMVDVDHHNLKVTDLLRNPSEVPASMQPYGTVALERPCDVKFGPDGALYILDFGRMDNDSAVPRYYHGTGRIFKLDAFHK